MRVLITGAWGFAGRHAMREFIGAGHEVIALDQASAPSPRDPDVPGLKVNIADFTAVCEAVANSAPAAVLHLAGIAFVPRNAAEPGRAVGVNVTGTINILEACVRHAPQARVLTISSAQVYGPQAAGGHPLAENAPLRPDTTYGITKAAADNLTLLYARQYNLAAMVARPSNHIGPGQTPDYSVSSFATQVQAIVRGSAPATITTGNLASRRDFTDVRDMVRAYRLLVERGQPGHAYNLGSGRMVSLGEVLDELCRLAGIHPAIVTAPELFRPTDQGPLLNVARIRDDTGWAPRYELSKTLESILASV